MSTITRWHAPLYADPAWRGVGGQRFQPIFLACFTTMSLTPAWRRPAFHMREALTDRTMRSKIVPLVQEDKWYLERGDLIHSSLVACHQTKSHSWFYHDWNCSSILQDQGHNCPRRLHWDPPVSSSSYYYLQGPYRMQERISPLDNRVVMLNSDTSKSPS